MIIGAVQIFKTLQQNCFIAAFLRKFQLMIIRAVQIFKSLQQNAFFAKISACDNRGSANFLITSTKPFIFAKISARDNRGSANFQNVLFLRKFQLLIIGEVQIFKSHQQNCFIFVNIPARDDRGSSNFQNTSTKLLYCCIFAKISAHDNKGSSNFQITSTKRFFLQKFQVVIIGAVQIF